MSVLIDNNTKAIFQGFTGSQATMHAEQCIDYGTNIIGGVTPGKGGQEHLNKPVFDSVKDACAFDEIDTSVIFVPAKFTKSAILEAAENGINLIICITFLEGNVMGSLRICIVCMQCAWTCLCYISKDEYVIRQITLV